MNKEKTRQFFVDFLTEYLQSCATAQYALQNFTERGADAIERNIKCFFENMDFAFGATRGCFIPSNYNYCLKIAFDTNENDYNSKELEIFTDACERNLFQCFSTCSHLSPFEIDVLTYSQQDFEAASDELSDNDDFDENDDFEQAYQWLEENNYEKKLIHYYIPMFIYRTYDRPFVAADNHPSQASLARVRSCSSSPLAKRNERIAAKFIDDWGIEVFDELTNLLNDWDVDDFHDGNVGIVDNKVVLIDYAGFDEY